MNLDPNKLPTSVIPLLYTLRLEPDLQTETFEGTVAIGVTVKEETQTIILNADGLTIESLQLSDTSKTYTCTSSLDAELQRLTIQTEETITPGDYTLSITFAGAFSSRFVGLYSSTFTDDAGAKHTIASTQFEAPHARKCFPCWDQPDFKAKFKLSLVIDSDLEARSNTEELQRTALDSGKTQIDFDTTVLLSTYLVAFVIGPLESSETRTVEGVPLTIWHRPGQQHLTDFALDIGAFALTYLTDYFGVPYSGQKIDLLAIPDFELGAMENQGCITFRESALLIDPSKATQPQLQRTADVIAHELAHMWFGNLVTMKWWNGLWLNEAFASFMEMKVTDAFKPEWGRWNDFGISRSAAFAVDATSKTRPIEYHVETPQDAEGMFDILTYEKGASLVRMLEQYLGEEPFREGIRHYIKQNSFANTETTDLWDALESVTDQPIRAMMNTWVFQGSFPVISVKPTQDGVLLSQRNVALPTNQQTEAAEWSIPVTYRWLPEGSKEVQEGSILLEKETTTLPVPTTYAWLLVNAYGSGFFKISYTQEDLEKLIENSEHLTAVERFNLVDDLWLSVLEGHTSANTFLRTLEDLSAEQDRAVWTRILSGISALSHILDGEAQERFQEIVHDIISPALARLGLAPADDEDDLTKQLRADLIKAMGILANDPEIQQEATRAFSIGIAKTFDVDQSVFEASLSITATFGDETDFETIQKAWQAANTPQEKVVFATALANFDEPELMELFHSLVLTEKIRSQDAPFLLARALLNRRTQNDTWTFIEQNWDTLKKIFGDNLLVRMLSGIVGLDRPEQAARVTAFLQKNPLAVGDKTLEQTKEKMQTRVLLREREAAALTAILVSQ